MKNFCGIINFKLFMESLAEPLYFARTGIMYQARRESFSGTDYDLSRLSNYEPANLGLFFTDSFDNAKKFYNVKEIDTVEVDKKNFAKKDAEGKNLREFVAWIKKQKSLGKPGVCLFNVIDGFFHKEINVVFSTSSIKRLSTTRV